MLPAGFEPVIPASELPHAHALHRAATGICVVLHLRYKHRPFGYHSSYYRRITVSTVATYTARVQQNVFQQFRALGRS